MVQQGIDGNDLLELKIISTERLPPVADDFTSASTYSSGWGQYFHRPGAVGMHPDGPKASYTRLSNLLNSALATSSTNLDDTATAIKHFLDEILDADANARERMNKSQRELEGTGDGS